MGYDIGFGLQRSFGSGHPCPLFQPISSSMSIRSLGATVLAVVFLTSASVLTVAAQDDGERGRPERGGRERGGPQGGRGPGGPGGPGFGGPGFGGPGGGMFGMGMGGRGVVNLDQIIVGLVNREEVQKELALLPDQTDALQKVNEKMRGERPDFDFRTASEEERSAFMTKMQAQMAERTKVAKEQLEELLLPDQFERLEQIAIQVAGVAALVSPSLAEKLGLAKETTDKMTKDVEASAEQGREMMNAAMRDRDFEGVREKVETMRQELNDKLIAHLSDDQKAKYEELKGKPFELAAMAPGGPGGFGGQRRGQGGPGGPGGERRRGGEGQPRPERTE